MILIGTEVIAYLKENMTFPGLSVKDYFSVKTLTPPLLTIKEIPTSTGVNFASSNGTSQTFIFKNSYEIEIYAKAQKVGGTNTTAANVAIAIFQEADEILNEKYGFSMKGDPNFAPFAADTSISRIVARYVAYIDSRNNKIYRSI